MEERREAEEPTGQKDSGVVGVESEDLAVVVRRLVDTLSPLSEEQRARLALLLMPDRMEE